MSFRCAACGSPLPDRPFLCPKCGAQTVTDPSNRLPLAELRPEAEPPLPAAHEALRQRTPPLGVPAHRPPMPGIRTVPGTARRDPTPGPRRDPTPGPGREPPPPRKDPPPTPPHARVAAETPFSAAPGPLVDPSAWFEDGSISTPPSGRVRLEDTPVERDTVVRTARAFESATRGAPPESEPRLHDDAPTPSEVVRAAGAPPPSPGEIPSLVGGGSRGRQIVVVLVLCIIGGALVGWLMSSGPGTPSDEAPARSAKPR